MFRTANCALLFLFSLIAASCSEKARTEKEVVATWNSRFVDSSYRLLYKDEDTARAISFYDSSLQQISKYEVYPQASRFGLLANYHYFFTSDNEATARMIDSAIALYNTHTVQDIYPRTYVSLLLFGGHIAYRLNQYSKANEYYFKAKKLADAHLDPCERTAFNYSIAMVLYRQQNFKESMNFFQQAYALQETCSPRTTANILQQQEIQSNIGLCLVELKEYDRALNHFDQAIQISLRYKDSLGPATMDKIYGVIYGNKAKVSMAKERLTEAEELSLKSIALNDRKGYEVENAMNVKLQLAEIYGRKKDLVKMSQVLISVQPGMASANAKTRLEWSRLQAAYYEKTSLNDSALLFYKSYFSLRDSIAQEQKQLTAADVARQLYEKEQEGEIAILKRDQHITLISLWVTIVLSCMSLIIIYLVYQNYRRYKKNLAISLALNEEIERQKLAREEEAKQRHKLITEAVIHAQESERSLICLELHDNIGQVLTTVKLHNEMLLEGIGDPKVVLPRTLQYLQNCITEIRGLSKRLSAPSLGKISLEDSVKDLIESINSTSKVKITRHISGLETATLRQDLHLGLYRILQEQLNNVLKHSEASEVIIQLEKNDDQLRLCIIDNGKGFAVGKTKAGIGLMNMQTRAENLNGIFKLKSQPGLGCKVEVVVPCP